MSDVAVRARDRAVGPAARTFDRVPAAWALAFLACMLALAVLIAVSSGAFPIGAGDALRILAHQFGLGDPAAIAPEQEAVLMSIRMPRVVLGILVGAGLAVAGTAMQALFRNPLADPTLIGVSAGGALAAATVIVMGVVWFPGITRSLGPATLPLAAFLGGLGAATLVYTLATHGGRTSIAILLLAGIAINALVEAGIGFYTYLANDEQLRNLAMWRLGSIGGANWSTLVFVGPAIALGAFILWRLAAPFNALALGESEASHLGVDVQRLKIAALVFSALVVGSAVAASGLIFFVGLLAPHMVRLTCGPNHHIVLPGSMLLGATLILAADTIARTLVAPAELPLGVFTAMIGAPFFIALLLRERRAWEA